MELHQIKSFVMVAQTKNLTRAAERLNTTPPSVSTHIRQLEAEFNVTLFTRTPRGMVITAQGKTLEKKARDILETTQAFCQTANRTAGEISGTLTLGINADPGYLKIQEIVHYFFQHYPDLTLEVVPSNTAEILKRITQGTLDLGYVFGSHDNPGLEFKTLSQTDLEILVPMQFKKSHENTNWKEITALPWIVPASLCPFLNQVKKIVRSKKLKLDNSIVANDDITRTAFINKGIAATVLERSEAHMFEKKGVAFIWDNHQPIFTRLSLVFSKQHTHHPGICLLDKTISRIWNSASHSQ